MATFKGIKLPDGTVYTPEGSGTAENGLPTGGVAGQALIKATAANYEADWEDIHQIPSGGTAGQVLTKDTGTNYDASWKTISGLLPTGGSTGQFLRKKSATNYAVEWVDAPEGGSSDSAGIVETVALNQSFTGSENAKIAEAEFSTAKKLRMAIISIKGADMNSQVTGNATIQIKVNSTSICYVTGIIGSYHNQRSQVVINFYDTFADATVLVKQGSSSDKADCQYWIFDNLTNQTDITSISAAITSTNARYGNGSKVRIVTYE